MSLDIKALADAAIVLRLSVAFQDVPGGCGAAMWLVGVGLVLAGLVVGTCGMHLIRTSELKNQSGHITEG